MADEKPKVDADFGKKCAATGVTIRPTRRYYRDGKYYKNKSTYVKMVRTQKEEARASAAESASAETPAGETPAAESQE